MKPHTTIFLDIDGTLIDINQKPNTDALYEQIRTMQQKGFQFGLNSNRSREDVEGVIHMFSLDGPFILENGAYMLDGQANELVCTNHTLDMQRVTQLAIAGYIRNNQEAGVQTVDTTSLYTGALIPENGLQIYINAFRKFSGSVHHRLNGTSDFTLATEIATYMQIYFDSNKLPLVAIAHEHGHSVTIEVEGVSKVTALKEYRKLHPYIKIIAIGDGINDVALHSEVDELFAVSNAIPELKAVASYTSPLPITQGVCDILTILQKDNCATNYSKK